MRIVQSSWPFLVAQWKYQMTLIWIFALNRSPDSFRQGVNAFRNAREWAMEKRDEFIAAVKRQGTNVYIRVICIWLVRIRLVYISASSAS